MNQSGKQTCLTCKIHLLKISYISNSLQVVSGRDRKNSKAWLCSLLKSGEATTNLKASSLITRLNENLNDYPELKNSRMSWSVLTRHWLAHQYTVCVVLNNVFFKPSYFFLC